MQKKILDDDHYGLDDVKKRIIEYLAVRKLKKDSKGSIILLVGPPGVGKTSVGRSIARSMNRPFFRFSVGGMRDEAEIKGHRRTYIGAMPGKIIQGLKIVKSKCPVFMIDEVDKMGISMQGDPSSALLEVLDPEQNITFRDHYLDLPFDISNILFILTANTLDSIPSPLLDRAEIITLSGYIDQEKMEIAKKYLIPKSLEKNGLKKNQVKYDKSSLLFITNSYAREAGVRNLEKCFDKIHRKFAAELISNQDAVKISEEIDGLQKTAQIEFEKEQERIRLENEKASAEIIDTPYVDAKKSKKKVKQQKAIKQVSEREKELSAQYNSIISVPLTVKTSLIEKYLGKPVFNEDEIKKADSYGTALGLAWTSMGGDTLIIEAITNAGKEGMQITGQLGDVMKESASIALSWVKQYAINNSIADIQWFEKNFIHLHVPEGATPKDGPSAGITMATALLSLIMKKPIKKALAMTGELSLTGQVLPIGGLREKTVAARRNKVKQIIIPKANIRDLDDIPEIVKQNITFHPVSSYDEVIKLVF